MPEKIDIILNGSSNGIDLEKFSKQDLDVAIKSKIKSLLPRDDSLKFYVLAEW